MTTIDYLQKELEKALDDIAYYKRRIERLNTQLQQKENIIKEVREYIEENYPTSTINYQDDKHTLLEILGSDKE